MNKTAEPTGTGREFLEAHQRTLAEIATRIAFWKGMEIGVQGEGVDSVYVIQRGQVLLNRRNTAAEDYALYLLGPGDLFGEGSLLPVRQWLATVRALTDGMAYTLPAARLPQIAQYYPQFAAGLMLLLSSRLERAHRRLDLVTTTSARDRVLGMLYVLADYHGEARGEELWLSVRITQSELGNMVGLARETVARAVNELEAEGLLRRKGRYDFWLRETPVDPTSGSQGAGAVG